MFLLLFPFILLNTHSILTSSFFMIRRSYTLPKFCNILFYLEHVYGAEIVATTTLQVVPGELDHEWKDHGLRLLIPADVLELNALPMTISIQASVNGYYQLPKETELVSGVYWIEFPGKLSRPITLELQHCASLEPSKLSLVKFVTAKCNQDILPYNFELVTGGKFSSNSSYGRVEMYISSGFAIIREYDGRKRYRLLTYYIPHAPTMWQLHLVLICDLQLYLQVFISII